MLTFNAKLFILFILLNLLLTGCGTRFACAPEFGRPPEREFWCAPLSSFGEFFTVQPKAIPQKEKVKCIDTIGDKECELK
ncbi:hypothetical protein OAK17_07530 [Alphaproteobacteria bacterium]|nr:hypothetical protein [Alphaproteobacteria bacterium]|tara:strand:- start:173 stop:412 length:240 start_codon:yes stop_codon:yes gene_type:complete